MDDMSDDEIHEATGAMIHRGLVEAGASSVPPIAEPHSDERQIRQKEKRNEAQRRRRREAGTMPRKKYEGASLEKLEPWKAAGKSRRWFYNQTEAVRERLRNEAFEKCTGVKPGISLISAGDRLVHLPSSGVMLALVEAADQDAPVVDSIDAILAVRRTQHGDFTDHARVTQNLKAMAKNHTNWHKLSAIQIEAIEMILHKIGRILSGNPDHQDHWDDIAGYAKLVSQRIVTKTEKIP